MEKKLYSLLEGYRMKKKLYSLAQAAEFIDALHASNPEDFMAAAHRVLELMYSVNKSAEFLSLTPRRIRDKIHQQHFEHPCDCPCGSGNWIIPLCDLQKEKVVGEIRGGKYKRKSAISQTLTNNVLR